MAHARSIAVPSEAPAAPDVPPRASRWRAAVVGLLAAVLLAGAWIAVPSDTVAGPSVDPSRLLIDAVAWIQGSGPLGDLLFVLLYGVQTVLLVPASWAHTSAGFVYGPFVGFAVASACATGWSAVNFWLGRTLFRGTIERRVARSRRLAALDQAMADHGVWTVILLRLPPISPFNPMSYALGATRVRFRDFLIGTWVGSLLPVLVFSQLGANLSDLAAFFAGEASGPGWLQWAGLGVTLVVTAIVTRTAKRALDAAAPGQPTAARQSASA